MFYTLNLRAISFVSLHSKYLQFVLISTHIEILVPNIISRYTYNKLVLVKIPFNVSCYW